ncbi:MAG: heavy metal translocating P-type ATPase [Acidimicrobiales bacterium]
MTTHPTSTVVDGHAASRYAFGVDGMTCASCVRRVERALSAVEGVVSARVNLATESAEVDLAGPVDTGVLAGAVKAAGYRAVLPEVTPDDAGSSQQGQSTLLEVTGMSCASCVRRVERALTGVEGVVSARVNLATESAEVDLAGPVESATLVEAVRSAGYQATVASPVSDPADEAAARRSRRQADLRRRRVKLAVGTALSAAVLVLAYGFATAGWSPYVQLALALPVFAWVGSGFHLGALKAARHRAVNMDTLVSLGSTVAFAYSVAATFALPGKATYFDVAAVIVTLISVGKYLEVLSRGRAGDAIETLAGLRPRTAHLLARAGASTAVAATATLEVAADALRVGDVILVRPGEALPADGTILGGAAAIDESMVSGESVPVTKAPGDEVTGGTVNGLAPLTVRVTRTGAETTLARITALVERAQLTKSKAQRLADQVSSVFVPVILIVAAVTFVGWFATGHALVASLIPAVAVLVVACPCALGLATPVAVMVGTGRGAELGLLISGAQVLERVRDLGVVVVDKTGTLTVGRPEIVEVITIDGADGTEALNLAAIVEAASEHPLARAVVSGAERRGIKLDSEAVTVEVSPGGGVEARIDGRRVQVGSLDWLAAPDSAAGPVSDQRLSRAVAAADRLAAQGHTPVGVAIDGEIRLVLGIADPLRADAASGVARLRAQGLRVVLATGDRAEVADAVGAQVGIDEVRAGLRPEDKARLVEQLRADHGAVAMVGDGINDAPALATADIGIAVGTGTGVAMAAADITLVHGDVGAVADAIALSRATRRTIWQNLGWAFGYNVVLVPLAAFGILPPMLAAAAMALSSVSVVTNALRLRRFGRTDQPRQPGGSTGRPATADDASSAHAA